MAALQVHLQRGTSVHAITRADYRYRIWMHLAVDKMVQGRPCPNPLTTQSRAAHMITRLPVLPSKSGKAGNTLLHLRVHSGSREPPNTPRFVNYAFSLTRI